MKNILYIFLLLNLFLVNSIEGQSSRKTWNTANAAFESTNYYEALEHFLIYAEEKELDAETKLKIGVSYFFTNDIQQGLPYLLDVTKSSKEDPKESAIFYLARSYHALLDFDKAVQYYKEYIKIAEVNDVLKSSIINEIKRCRTGIKVSAMTPGAYVENLGGLVNNLGDDFAPIFSFNRKGRIYFSSQRKGSIGGLRNKKGVTDLDNGTNDYDVYFTDINNGSWSVAKRMPDFVNTVRNDVLQDFTSNGRVMQIFRSLNNYSGIIALDTFRKDRKKDLKYYFLTDAIEAENGDKALFYYNDSTLLFASDRPGGFGGKDIYMTIQKEGHWTRPLNLGPTVNSPYDETSPYLANDGKTLFFSSNNLNSIGGLDIFSSTFDPGIGIFQSPKNLGIPINSSADDQNFRFDRTGLQGLFASSRKEGMGQRDIYLAYFNKRIISAPQKNYPFIVDLYLSDTTSIIVDTEVGNTSKLQIEPLYYTSDGDVLSRNNKKNLDNIIDKMIEFDTTEIEIEVYSDDTDISNAFNLFSSIKKGEKVKEYLIEKGVENKRIYIRGMGKNYPLALSFVNNKLYPFGKKINQRIDLILKTNDQKNLKVSYKEPKVPGNIRIESNKLLKKRLKGLTFRVEIAYIGNIYHGEDLENYEEPMIELLPNETKYRYSVGLSSNFTAIKILYKGIVKKNNTAQINAYLDGNRISKSRLKELAKKNRQAQAYLSFIEQDQ